MKKKFPVSILLGAIAIAAAVSVGAFIIYTLMLRSSFKADALRINEAFRTHPVVTMSKEDVSFQHQTSDIEYYNMFLLDGSTTVFSRKPIPETDDTILLDFGQEKLSFTGVGDGSAIAVCWTAPGEEKHYIVRSQITFSQLNSFFTNCFHQTGSSGTT